MTRKPLLSQSRRRRMLWGGYSKKVLSYDPIAYWPLSEGSGTVATELVNGWNGAYVRNVATMGTGAGIGDGNTAPLFDGGQDSVNIYSSALNTAFNGQLFSMLLWAKTAGAGVWTDGSFDYAFQIYVDANNYFMIRKDDVNNQLSITYRSGAATKTITATSQSDTGWMCWAVTVSLSADAFKAYKNGAQQGSTISSLGTWAGNLALGEVNIGSWSEDTNEWNGYLANVAIFDKVLDVAQVLDLATV